MRTALRTIAFLLILLSLTPALCFGADDVADLLGRIKAVGREGAGNVEAAGAWRQLAQRGPESLLKILAGLDHADATASNWIRAAVDAIAEREVTARRPLPTAELEAFILQTKHAPQARRLAYEWLTRVDPTTPSRLLPGMLQDPSPELRRDAVARVLKQAEEVQTRDDKPALLAAYRKALSGARDRDQVDLIAGELKKLGETVDLAAHFGFIQKWQIAAPFDNTGGTGFGMAFPPEKRVDLTAGYQGKKGEAVRWVETTTTDPYGMVDLNKVVGKHMGVTGYAFAAVMSPAERPVQLRAGSNNAVKLFLNGKPLFAREEYHHGLHMDQHVGFGTLKAGRNEVLIKVCQNEQADAWAQLWSFQLRLCDSVGGAVPFTVVPVKVAEGKVRP